MTVQYHKNFIKQFKKLPIKVREQFQGRLLLFLTDKHHPLLKVHTLKGEKHPYESMNVNADYRALLLTEDNETTFYEIGTHSSLYKK